MNEEMNDIICMGGRVVEFGIQERTDGRRWAEGRDVGRNLY